MSISVEVRSIQRCIYTIRPALRVVRLFPLFVLMKMVEYRWKLD